MAHAFNRSAAAPADIAPHQAAVAAAHCAGGGGGAVVVAGAAGDDVNFTAMMSCLPLN